MYNLDLDKICPSYCTVVHSMSTGLESIKESCTLESSTLAILTLYLGGEGRDHTCAESDVPSRVELSSFIDSALGWGEITFLALVQNHEVELSFQKSNFPKQKKNYFGIQKGTLSTISNFKKHLADDPIGQHKFPNYCSLIVHI